MKIGITYTGDKHKHNNYHNWITGNDDITVIKLSEKLNNLTDVAGCDGIILSGGIDIHPTVYGGNEKYDHAPEKFNHKRDEFELNVLKIALEKNIPVLGICRGMQLINCYHGGTLIQDLEEKNHVHKITELNDKQHGIHIVPDSTIQEIINDHRVAVNSAHHQAIHKPGEGLHITATSEDGIPEVLERKQPANASFLMGVQWHPERMYHFNLHESNASAGLRKKFLFEVKRNKNACY